MEYLEGLDVLELLYDIKMLNFQILQMVGLLAGLKLIDFIWTKIRKYNNIFGGRRR